MDIATQIELTEAFRTLIEQGRETPALTGAGDWLDINPAYVLTVKAADGAEYAKHREAFGDPS